MNKINVQLNNDTYVYSEYDNRNYCRSSNLKVGNTASKDGRFSRGYTTLIKFDINEISDLSTINEASIYLYIEKINAKRNDSITLSLSMNISDYELTDVTAKNLPITNSTDIITHKITKENTNKFIKVDITEFVKQWASNTSPNFGMTISVTSNNDYIDFSSSRSSNAPYVVINYTPMVQKQSNIISEPIVNTAKNITSASNIISSNEEIKPISTLNTGTTISKAYCFIYNQSPAAVIVHGGSDITFSNNSLLNNISHDENTTDIKIKSTGLYEINYSLSASFVITSEISLTKNGTIIPGTSRPLLQSNNGITGTAILSLSSSDIITLRNTSASVLKLSPNVNTQLTIIQIDQ